MTLEPGRRVFPSLARNAAPPRLTTLEVAASDSEGEAEFYEAAMSDLSSLERVKESTSFKVTLTRLDTLAKEHGHPDFVKIHVEGHEPAVLRGMAGLFASIRPPLILFEALDRIARDNCLAVIHSLARGDYQVLRLGKSGNLSVDLEIPGCNDYLFFPACATQRIQ